MCTGLTREFQLKSMLVKVTGISPLIQQADVLADPIHPMTLALRSATSKAAKNRTDEDWKYIEACEMRAQLYWDDSVGVHIPESNMMKCLIEGARLTKQGKNIERGLFIAQDMIPLTYRDGKVRDVESLIKDPRFKYRKTVVVGKARSPRARPIFRDWSCELEIKYDPQIIKNDAHVMEMLTVAGSYVGIGGRRIGKGGRFGRFEVSQ